MHQRRCNSNTCNQHLLLDHLHVYNARLPWEANWNARRSVWRGSWSRRKNIPQLLSMGTFYVIFPGKRNLINFSVTILKPQFAGNSLLRTSLDLEKLGARKNSNDLRGHSRSVHRHNWGTPFAAVATGSLHPWQSTHPQLVCIWIFSLRSLEFCQCRKYHSQDRRF